MDEFRAELTTYAALVRCCEILRFLCWADDEFRQRFPNPDTPSIEDDLDYHLAWLARHESDWLRNDRFRKRARRAVHSLNGIARRSTLEHVADELSSSAAELELLLSAAISVLDIGGAADDQELLDFTVSAFFSLASRTFEHVDGEVVACSERIAIAAQHATPPQLTPLFTCRCCRDTFQVIVEEGGRTRTCKLNPDPYAFMEVLLKEPGRYVPIEEITHQIGVNEDNLATTKCRLIASLKANGFGFVARCIDGSRPGHYAFLLPSRPVTTM